jgi:uroporphyrinogen decarboxylase
MTHRERYRCAINHRTPDRIPFDLDGTTLTSCHEEFMKKLIDWCAVKADTREEAVEKILCRYDIDFRRVGELFGPQSALLDVSTIGQGRFTDSWGIERAFTGIYWDIISNPLKDATLEEMKAFPWPDASQIDPKRLEMHADKAKRLFFDTDYVVVAEHPVFGYLELGCWMFGFDDFLYRLLGEPETVEWFFQKYHRYVTDVCELYYGRLGEYIHLTTSGDDFGTQKGPFLSPALFRSSIAPWYKKRITCIKNICQSQVQYFHHSCGSVFRLMDSIIDMGVDILNPIQPGTFEMEPERLKSAFGDRIVFWGGIDEQNLLSHATPEEIRNEVRRVCCILNQCGGYVMAASHNIQPDVPVENINAMFLAFDE